MKSEIIKIVGARENNLKNITVEIPKYQLIAFTGVSGSGKSSFAMDILQKECQRQYLESMGMVTDGLNKPLVETITGLSPSISIGQRTLSNNPRSTVGTYTEILTYLRILYAKLATRSCPHCQNKIPASFDNVEEIDHTDVICTKCLTKLSPLTMASFSFNKPEGACKKCKGIGSIKDVDYSKIIDESLTIKEGAIKIWGNEVFWEHYSNVHEACGKHYGFNFDVSKPISQYNELERLVLMEGVDSIKFKKLFPNSKKPRRVMDGYVEGLQTFVNKKVIESATKKVANTTIAEAIISKPCDECHGSRLDFDGRTATIETLTISDVSTLTMHSLLDFINTMNEKLSSSAQNIASIIIIDILKRIHGIIKIGLDYLSIDRPISTLSGGESQRLRLTSILESALTGVLYILDEPTTGLHPKDTQRLLSAIKRLRDLGNTVIVIEHDMSFVWECDHVIDFGIGAGEHGGQIVAQGTPQQILNSSISKTAKYLKPTPITLNHPNTSPTQFIEITQANAHNLKNISLKIPLSQFVSFAGVSGSGKSSLVFDVIEKNSHAAKISGLEHLSQIIKIDQAPIGRQSRSNIATYSEVFSLIRELFASQESSKHLKLKASDFSFNVRGGRCEKCEGMGVIALDMQFLDDVEVICPVCNGHRFSKKILSVEYNGKNISDVLNATVLECITFFNNQVEIIKKLSMLEEVGLAYLKLGQSTSTLSGGECQRLKLSKELSKGKNGHILYLLDEPTTGLHPSDSEKLIVLLKKLVNQNNSVFVIEHAIDVLAQSDYIIELGPQGGDHGGQIIATGTPLQLSLNPNSISAKYLKPVV